MNFCPNCGAKTTNPDDQFCMNCGQQLATAPANAAVPDATVPQPASTAAPMAAAQDSEPLFQAAVGPAQTWTPPPIPPDEDEKPLFQAAVGPAETQTPSAQTMSAAQPDDLLGLLNESAANADAALAAAMPSAAEAEPAQVAETPLSAELEAAVERSAAPAPQPAVAPTGMFGESEAEAVVADDAFADTAPARDFFATAPEGDPFAAPAGTAAAFSAEGLFAGEGDMMAQPLAPKADNLAPEAFEAAPPTQQIRQQIQRQEPQQQVYQAQNSAAASLFDEEDLWAQEPPRQQPQQVYQQPAQPAARQPAPRQVYDQQAAKNDNPRQQQAYQQPAAPRGRDPYAEAPPQPPARAEQPMRAERESRPDRQPRAEKQPRQADLFEEARAPRRSSPPPPLPLPEPPQKRRSLVGSLVTVIAVVIIFAVLCAGTILVMLYFQNRPAKAVDAFVAAVAAGDTEELAKITKIDGAAVSAEGWTAFLAAFDKPAARNTLKAQLLAQAEDPSASIAVVYPAVSIESRPFILFIEKYNVVISGVQLLAPGAPSGTVARLDGVDHAGTSAADGELYNALMPGRYDCILIPPGTDPASVTPVEVEIFEVAKPNVVGEGASTPTPEPTEPDNPDSEPASTSTSQEDSEALKTAKALTEAEINTLLGTVYQSYLDAINKQDTALLKGLTSSGRTAMGERVVSDNNKANLYSYTSAAADAGTIKPQDVNGVPTVTLEAAFKYKYQARDKEGAKLEDGSNTQKVELVYQDGNWMVNKMTIV